MQIHIGSKKRQPDVANIILASTYAAVVLTYVTVSVVEWWSARKMYRRGT